MAQKIKFFTDEHVAYAVIQGLRQRGVEVLSIPDAAMLGERDEIILTKATAEGFVIFTQDNDFLRLHASGVGHAGIVYATQYMPIGEIIRGLMLIYEVLGPEEMRNHVEFL
jgi:Domain of unknown function (DUF5615)